MPLSPTNPVQDPPADPLASAALLARAWDLHLVRPEEAYSLADAAYIAARVSGTPYLIAWSLLTKALARWRWIGADARTLDIEFKEAEVAMHALGDPRGLRLAELRNALLHAKLGQWQDALVYFEALVGRFDVNQFDADNFYPLLGLATSYVYCGNLAEGLRFGYAGLHMSQQLNLAPQQATMALPLGVALMAVRDPEEAATVLERAELVAEQIDSPMLLKAIRTNLAICNRRLVRYAEAEERIRWVLQQPPGMIGGQQFAHFTAAELFIQQGRVEEAAAELERAHRFVDPHNPPLLDAAKTHFIMGLICSRRDQLDEACHHLQQVVELLPQVSALRFSDRALVHEEYAAVLARLGRFEGAYKAQLRSSQEYLSNVSVLNRVRQFSMQVRHEISRVRAQLAEAAEERRTLQTSNRQLARAIEQTLNEAERFKHEAHLDALTGLLNRRYLDEALPKLLTMAQHSATPVAIAIIDLDRFKRVNDEYGHAMGDEVLRGFAAMSQDLLRGSDIIGRYGGEEFVAAIIGCGPGAAERRLEDLQARMREAHFSLDGREISGVTFTAGVAIYPEDGVTIEQLMKRADDRMYRAKNAGRQRIVTDDTVRLFARPGMASGESA